MKFLLFLISLLPLSVKAQLFEPLDKWGSRVAYTHTNGSRNFIFWGISLNSIDVDPSGLAAIGAKVYAGSHTEAITPRIGLSLVNAFEFYWGYSFPFKEGTSFKGSTFSFIINIYEF